MNFSLKHFILDLCRPDHRTGLRGPDIFKSIGPGLLVTVGFIDTGNWASNVAAGVDYRYELLWMVTLSTIMFIVLQHTEAHLGIFLISNPFKGLIYSQMLLSIKLPNTIFTQIYLTTSPKVMGKYANSKPLTFFLLLIGGIVTFLNKRLLISFL